MYRSDNFGVSYSPVKETWDRVDQLKWTVKDKTNDKDGLPAHDTTSVGILEPEALILLYLEALGSVRQVFLRYRSEIGDTVCSGAIFERDVMLGTPPTITK